MTPELRIGIVIVAIVALISTLFRRVMRDVRRDRMIRQNFCRRCGCKLLHSSRVIGICNSCQRMI